MWRISICLYHHDDLKITEYQKVCKANSVLKTEIEELKLSLGKTAYKFELVLEYLQKNLKEVEKLKIDKQTVQTTLDKTDSKVLKLSTK